MNNESKFAIMVLRLSDLNKEKRRLQDKQEKSRYFTDHDKILLNKITNNIEIYEKELGKLMYKIGQYYSWLEY